MSLTTSPLNLQRLLCRIQIQVQAQIWKVTTRLKDWSLVYITSWSLRLGIKQKPYLKYRFPCKRGTGRCAAGIYRERARWGNREIPTHSINRKKARYHYGRLALMRYNEIPVETCDISKVVQSFPGVGQECCLPQWHHHTRRRTQWEPVLILMK